MDGFDPATSFGCGRRAARTTTEPRGGEAETVDLLARARRGRAGPGARRRHRRESPCRWPSAGCRWTASSSRRTWSRGCARSPAATTSRDDGRHVARRRPGHAIALVYLVYNTIYNLLTQDDQVRCFENAARHLDADGVFLVEAGTPEAWLRGRSSSTSSASATDEVRARRAPLRPGHADPRREPRAP